MSEQDTRERLEADVHQYANPSGYKNTLGACWEKKMLSFLDRQAAITEHEVKERVNFSLITQTANALFPDYQERIDELTAERDELRERVRKLTMKIMAMEDKHKIDSERWVGIAHQHQEDLREIMELRDKLAEKQHVCDVQRDSFLKLERENRELQDMCGELEHTLENLRSHPF